VPTELEMTTRVHAHPIHRLRGGAIAQSGEVGGLSWSYSIQPTPDGAEARARVRWEARVVSATDFDAVRATVKKLFAVPNRVEFDNQVIRLLDEGRVTEAAAAVDGIPKTKANDALVTSLRSRIAIAAGLLGEARRLAKEAVSKDPESLPALRHLGWTLSLGDEAVPLRPGMDRAGALAAFGRVLERDPDSLWTRLRVADLLSRDGMGILGGPGSQVEDALRELRTVRAQGNGDGDDLYVKLLWSTRRDEELLEAKSTTSPDARSLAAFARSRGVGPALDWLDAASGANRDGILSEAVLELYSVRDYSVARELVGHLRDPRVAVLKDALLSVRRREEVPVHLDDPLDLIVEVAAQELDAIRRTGTDLSSPKDRAVASLLATMRDVMPLSVDSILDLIHSSSDVTEEDLPDVGLLVTVRLRISPQDKNVVLLQKTDGGLRMHPSQEPAAMVREGWKALTGGEIETARGWMRAVMAIYGDWLQEPYPSFVRSRLTGSAHDLALALAVLAPDLDGRSKEILATLELRSGARPAQKIEEILVGRSHFLALVAAKRYDDALEHIATSEQEGLYFDPEAIVADLGLVLSKQGQVEALEALGRTRLAEAPASRMGYQALTRAAILQRDFRGYREACLRMAQLGLARESALNDAAWISLRLGVKDEDVRYAELAAGPNLDRISAVDTLAVLLAERGEVDRSLRVLARLSQLQSPEEMAGPSVTYARARIAEALGFPSVAADLYRRIGKSTEEINDLSDLVERRLRALHRTSRR